MLLAQTILYCNCSWTDIVPPETRRAVLAVLPGAGTRVVTVPDLCELAARKDPLLAELCGQPGLAVVACYTRAVRWLFAAAGAALPEEGVQLLNMRTLNAQQIIESLNLPIDGTGGDAGDGPPRSGSWPPWFPVLDYDQCVDCRQCLSFCPFGVYELSSAGRVTVANPRNCKNNCPACARICPQAAIMFPKHGPPPINGAEVRQADLAQRQGKSLRERLDTEDIHAILAARSACKSGCGKPCPREGTGA